VNGPRLRVLLADDHTLVRAGIRRILEGQPGLEVVAEADDGAAALEAMRTAAPDIAVLDLKMPGADQLDLVRAAKSRWPAMKVIVLTMHAGPEYVARAVRGGADAYLLKDSAVAAVAAGGSYFSPPVQQQLAGLLRSGSPAVDGRSALTEREREVLTWLARGLSSRQVAEQLSISVRTVETHRANLMQKLGVKSVALLIQAAIRDGIIEQP